MGLKYDTNFHSWVRSKIIDYWELGSIHLVMQSRPTSNIGLLHSIRFGSLIGVKPRSVGQLGITVAASSPLWLWKPSSTEPMLDASSSVRLFNEGQYLGCDFVLLGSILTLWKDIYSLESIRPSAEVGSISKTRNIYCMDQETIPLGMVSRRAGLFFTRVSTWPWWCNLSDLGSA